MSAVVKWTWVAVVLLNIVLTITMVGRPRKPITPGLAAGVVLWSLFWATAVILTWDTSR